MFDEIVLKFNLGCKLLPGHLVVGRFGRNRSQSVAAISHTLDKIVIYDTSAGSPFSSTRLSDCDSVSGDKDESDASGSGVGLTTYTTGQDSTSGFKRDQVVQSATTNSQIAISSSVYYIVVKDVIKTISVKNTKVLLTLDQANRSASVRISSDELKAKNNNEQEHARLDENRRGVKEEEEESSGVQVQTGAISEDLLLIGCSSSILVYDVFNRGNLTTINTATSINAMSSSVEYIQQLQHATPTSNSETIQFRGAMPNQNYADQLIICGGAQRLYILKFETNPIDRFHVELSSGRSIEDTITCMIRGKFIGLELVVTGCVEEKIRIHQLDPVDQNIQACKLTIEESSQINCLCAINTHSNIQQPPYGTPTTNQNQELKPTSCNLKSEQMNYFSYGLKSGFIGVYRLFSKSSDMKCIGSESLWRQKCKYTPLMIMMYDINGDGLDELVIGFKNGRIEARSPFTGQLLAATRCFKTSDRLVGLVVLDYNLDGRLTLLACSTGGSIIGFRPDSSKPRIPLQGYSLPTISSKSQNDSSVDVSSNNLKTIAEEQELIKESDSFKKTTTTTTTPKKEETDLHKESTSQSTRNDYFYHDNSKPLACAAKQSFELLQRISSLQSEQLELEKKACLIYHTNVYQAPNYYPTDINVAHRWHFDPSTVFLKLTIVISTNLEDIKLIKLIDQSKNFITTGHLLIKPREDEKLGPKSGESYKFVVPVRSSKNVDGKLELKIFCQMLKGTYHLESGTNNQANVARIHHRAIHVPKYSMFTFFVSNNMKQTPDEFEQTSPATVTGAVENDARHDKEEDSKIINIKCNLKDESKAMQVLDWINESFLCFQFERLFSKNHSDTRKATGAKSVSDRLAKIREQSNLKLNNFYDDDNKNFELNLIDVRQTLKRMAGSLHQKGRATGTTTAAATTTTTTSNNNIDSDECKFFQSASMLRITHSAGSLEFACESPDLAVDLVQSLMIDRLNLDLTSDGGSKLREQGEFSAHLEPLLSELNQLTRSMRELEESEKRIQTELYESAEHTKNLMQQFAIANELNEFSTAKDLLNELSIMLAQAQNAARAHCLNSRRPELSKRISHLKGTIAFLSGRETFG